MEGEKFTYTFDSKDSGSLPVSINIDWGEAEAEIDDQLYYIPPRERHYRVFDQGAYQSVIDGTAGY